MLLLYFVVCVCVCDRSQSARPNTASLPPQGLEFALAAPRAICQENYAPARGDHALVARIHTRVLSATRTSIPSTLPHGETE